MTDESFVVTEKGLIDWLRTIRDARYYKFELYGCEINLLQTEWNKRSVAAFVRKSRHYDARIGVSFCGGYDVKFEPMQDTQQTWRATISEPEGAGAIHRLREAAIADDSN